MQLVSPTVQLHWNGDWNMTADIQYQASRFTSLWEQDVPDEILPRTLALCIISM